MRRRYRQGIRVSDRCDPRGRNVLNDKATMARPRAHGNGGLELGWQWRRGTADRRGRDDNATVAATSWREASRYYGEAIAAQCGHDGTNGGGMRQGSRAWGQRLAAVGLSQA